MKDKTPSDEEEKKIDPAAVAAHVLQNTGFSVVDAARVALENHEALALELEGHPAPVRLCQRIIQLGTDAYKQEQDSATFREALEQSLMSRSSRRLRTIAEIRQCCRRVLRHYPTLADTPVRRVSASMCHDIVYNVFTTTPSRRKARRLLHGIFAFSLRHGWCSFNPMVPVDVPPAQETPIEILTIKQIRRLLATVRKTQHLPCAAAVGIMLWAGIRPMELTRLRWEHINFEQKVITIEARHAKTGGARHVTLHPVLIRWLRETTPYRLPKALIVPRAWERRWRALRQAAGFSQWHPDTLRHTFASYHFKRYASFSLLQVEMGHADANLLRTRYLGMKGVTHEGAAEFWGERRKRRRSEEAEE